MINIGQSSYGDTTIGMGRKMYAIYSPRYEQFVKVSHSSRFTFSKRKYAEDALRKNKNIGSLYLEKFGSLPPQEARIRDILKGAIVVVIPENI